MIKFRTTQSGNTWIMKIVPAGTESSPLFEDLLNKVVKELQDHPYARRMSWDQWWWKNKKEMSKFITYWNLKQ